MSTNIAIDVDLQTPLRHTNHRSLNRCHTRSPCMAHTSEESLQRNAEQLPPLLSTKLAPVFLHALVPLLRSALGSPLTSLPTATAAADFLAL